MNLQKHKEILSVSSHLGHTGNYEIRKYRNSGGYVLIDILGDEICLEGIILSDHEANSVSTNEWHCIKVSKN